MIDRFRNWLAGVLATAPIATEAPELPAPPKQLPKPRTSMADAPVVKEAAADDEELKKAQRRLKEVEVRAQKAEDRAKRAETARGELEASGKTVESRVTAALERAKKAEQALKKALDDNARGGKKRRGKNDNAEAQVRAAEERARSTADRARAAEAKLDDAESRAQASEKRARELTAKVTELEKRPAQEPAAPPARESLTGSAPRELGRDRGRSATQMEVHFSPGDECLLAIRRQLDQAERTADVCVFTITDDRIASAIMDAHRRGVRVRIITDNDKSHDEGSDVRRLESAGMEVREDRTECHMHHKFAIFDGRVVLTGSYNWTRGAARNNEENLVVSNDPRLIGPFEREFNALWGRLARD